MDFPIELKQLVEAHHHGGVTEADCRDCSSGCCSHGGFAILENVLAIFELYRRGRLKRKGHRFPRGMSLEDFIFTYFDVWERPVGPEEDGATLMFFHMKSLDERGRPIHIPGDSFWQNRIDLFDGNPWLNHGCVFLSEPVPPWPEDDGRSRRHCILHQPDSNHRIGAKPIDCTFFTCTEPYQSKAPEKDVTAAWFHELAMQFPESAERFAAICETHRSKDDGRPEE